MASTFFGGSVTPPSPLSTPPPKWLKLRQLLSHERDTKSKKVIKSAEVTKSFPKTLSGGIFWSPEVRWHFQVLHLIQGF